MGSLLSSLSPALSKDLLIAVVVINGGMSLASSIMGGLQKTMPAGLSTLFGYVKSICDFLSANLPNNPPAPAAAPATKAPPAQK